MKQRSSETKAVIFDLNGTLNDMGVLREQNKHVAWHEFGIRLTDDEILSCWGAPAPAFYSNLYRPHGITLPWSALRSVFQQYNHMFQRRLMPHTLDTIRTLRAADMVLSIVTQTPAAAVEQFIQDTGLARSDFRFIHTGREIERDVAAGLPPLHRAVAEFAMDSIRPTETVFVGDEPGAAQDAATVGIDFVVVSNGVYSRDRLLREKVPAEHIIDHLGQLHGWLGIDKPT